ncbi:MAG: metal ABC transporter substrate-binding protein [Promethearchaeota archaeon]
MRQNWLLAITCIMLLSVGALSTFPQTSAQTTPALHAAVSIQSLTGIVREVGGSQLEVSTLLPEGVEPHAFTLTQAVIDAAYSSDLLVLTGHFEWEEELATQVGKPYITLEDYKTFGAELLSFSSADSSQRSIFDEKRQDSQDENLHGYWLLPKNAIAIANATRDLCSTLNSTYSQYWHNRFNEFVSEVSELEAFISEQRLLYELSNKNVIITFPAEAYIVEALGLQVKGLLIRGESVFISGPELIAVEQALQNGSIDLIIASDVAQLQASGEFAQQLSTDSGVPLVWVRVVFSVLEDYIGIMAYNIGAITTGVSAGLPPATDFLTISMPVIIIAAVLGILAVIELVLLVRCTRASA